MRDDIYLTSLTPELSFFQSIGDTRRQGIEFGIAGEHGKSDLESTTPSPKPPFNPALKHLAPTIAAVRIVALTLT